MVATGVSCDVSIEKDILTVLGTQTAAIIANERALADATAEVKSAHGLQQAILCRDKILPAMLALRTAVDTAETVVGREYWGLPDYGDILYSVKY